MVARARVLLAGAIAAIVITLAACSNPPQKGYVWSVNYEPASTIYWPGHYTSSCTGTGSNRRCTSSYDPGWNEYVPESWQIQLCAKPGAPSSSNSCGWRDVDAQTYHSVRLGQWWTAVAG